ncbi:CoA-binding protein [bacterium]|nr:CoA-binding protein [bacterium]
MPSNHELFFELPSFAVVGHTKAQNFPTLSYKGLKKMGKTVFPIDPSIEEVDGDKTFKDIDSLPNKVSGIILEVPKAETKEWISKAAKAGIKDVWIHMQRDTEEALTLAKDNGMNVRTGTCAVMYVTPGLTYHSIHKFIMKLIGKY